MRPTDHWCPRSDTRPGKVPTHGPWGRAQSRWHSAARGLEHDERKRSRHRIHLERHAQVDAGDLRALTYHRAVTPEAKRNVQSPQRRNVRQSPQWNLPCQSGSRSRRHRQVDGDCAANPRRALSAVATNNFLSSERASRPAWSDRAFHGSCGGSKEIGTPVRRSRAGANLSTPQRIGPMTGGSSPD